MLAPSFRQGFHVQDAFEEFVVIEAAAVAAAPAAAQQPDRWQMYAEAMAGCASEKFFARFMCEQKTRARFCDGYWNKVPQCAVDNPTDRNRGQ